MIIKIVDLLLSRYYISKSKNKLDNFNRILNFGDLIENRVYKRKLLKFDESCTVHDSTYIYGKIMCGNNVWFGPNTLIDGLRGKIKIGNYVDISAGVHIYTHNTVNKVLTSGEAEISKGDVTIGNNVYIGPNTIISHSVTIGDNVIIGANTFINFDIESNTKVYQERLTKTIDIDID